MNFYRQARIRIVGRLDQMQAGLRGALVLLLCGGDKRTRKRDIETAHAYWQDYKSRTR